MDQKIDLSLVPMEELMGEAERRCACFVASYQTHENKARKEYKSYYGKGKWMEAVGLTAILQNDIMNEWNGDIQSIQDSSDDEE